MFPENWLDHLMPGWNRDPVELRPRVVDGNFTARPMVVEEWTSLVSNDEIGLATRHNLCYAGVNLILFLKEEAWQVENFNNEVSNFKNKCETIHDRLKDKGKWIKRQPGDKKKRGAGKDDFVTEIDDPVQATGEKIQQVVSDMLGNGHRPQG